MKKIVAFTVLAGFVTASLLSGCGNASKEHLKDANENLKEASEDLNEAAKDANEEAKRKATADWQKFKNESESTMAAIDKQVLDLKDKIAKANDKEKARLNSELNKLEQNLNEQKEKLNQKNAEFEADLKTFNETVVTKYESFEREFKHDNDNLGTALKDLVKDNVK
jgi:septal ring factor EnvC (AmiA/AmiB activator)